MTCSDQPLIADKATCGKVRYEALTGIRFVAAACIVLFHMPGSLGVPVTLLGQTNLAAAVSFFYILSGFIISYNYSNIRGSGDIQRFYIKRWFRIWPVHLVTLIIIVMIIPQMFLPQLSALSGLILCSNLLLVQAWIPLSNFYFSYNSVSWSASVEWFFYLIFPIILIFGGRTQRGMLVIFLGALLLHLFLINTSGFLPDYTGVNQLLTSHPFIYVSPLTRVYEFIFGLILHRFFQYTQEVKIPLIAQNLVQIFFMGLSVIYMLPSWERQVIVTLTRSFPLQIFINDITGMIIWGGLIYSLTFRSGWIRCILSSKTLVYLGELSFAIYMVHYPICTILMDRIMPVKTASFLNIMLYMSMVLLMACALHSLVEKIGIRFGRNIEKSF